MSSIKDQMGADTGHAGFLNTGVTSLRIPMAARQPILDYAEARGLSLAALARLAIAEYIDTHPLPKKEA